MSDNHIDDDELRIMTCGIAEVSKNLDSILIRPVEQDVSKEEDIGYLVVFRHRVKEARAREMDTLLLDSFREIRLPELQDKGLD